MYWRSLSYRRFSGTVRNVRSAALQTVSACSRRLCRTDLRAGCGVVCHNPPVLQLNNAIPIGGISLRVCDLDDRCTGVIQFFEELHDLFALCGMEIPSRLIGEDQLWAEDHRAGHSDKLLLAAGKLVREKIFLADDVESVEAIANQADPLFVRHILVGKRYFQIFEDRQIVDQVIALKHESNVCLMQFVPIFNFEFVNVLAEEVIVPAPRAIQHSEDAQQRRLSRAVSAHDGDKFPRLNIQIDSAQQEELIRSGLDHFFQISQSNQWFHNFSLPHCRESGQQHSKSLPVSLL